MAVYKSFVSKGQIKEDMHQIQALEQFEKLHHQVLSYDDSFISKESNAQAVVETIATGNSWFQQIMGFSSHHKSLNAPIRALSKYSSVPKGLYVHGGTGCG